MPSQALNEGVCFYYYIIMKEDWMNEALLKKYNLWGCFIWPIKALMFYSMRKNQNN